MAEPVTLAEARAQCRVIDTWEDIFIESLIAPAREYVERETGFLLTDLNTPAGLKRAMLLLIGHWFENRSGITVGVKAEEVPLAINSLCRQHWVPRA